MRTFIFLFAVLVSLGLCSCQEPLMYSCDEELNDWVIDNMEDIHLLSRSEWCKLEMEYQVPAYRAFVPKQKQNFWIQKLEEVMELDWNQKEKDHLKVLCDYIKENPHIFESSFWQDEAAFIEFDKFQYKWVCYAQSELKWKKEIIAAIAVNGHKMKNKEGELDIPIESLLVAKSSSETSIRCSCCSHSDWCSSGFCEKTGRCEYIHSGCGTLMMYECDGLCSGF